MTLPVSVTTHERTVRMARGTLWLLVVATLGAAVLLSWTGVQATGQDPTAGAAHVQTVLQRLKRHVPTTRGDRPGQIRIKWEWYDSVVGSYLFEKRNLAEELSAGEKFLLRQDWVFRDTRVTFQEIFGLGPSDDDKLLPILSHYSLLASAPASTLEGLMLYGKQGEEKGPITRKYMAPGPSGFLYVLEFKKPNGDLDVALGYSYDAFNVRWKDVKDRVADESSQEKLAEDRRLLREAYEKAFSESERAR